MGGVYQKSGRHSRTARSRQKMIMRRRGNRAACLETQAQASPQELRRMVQLVICCGIFVLLVAAKLLLPGKMDQINIRIHDAMQQNIDVQAVFSAVGRTFSGNLDGKDLYQAVFGPQKVALSAESISPIQIDTKPNDAMEFMHQYRDQMWKNQAASQEKSAATMACIQYSQKNLPENVSLEQSILGFDYCNPVVGTVSSGFGYREHPTKGKERFHYGVDLAADKGTEIRCFADGTVTAVGESSSYGKYCIVDHDGGYETLYAHCNKIGVSSGSAIGKGQKLGEVGDTGVATGAHLHFELHRNGVYLNPIYYVE